MSFLKITTKWLGLGKLRSRISKIASATAAVFHKGDYGQFLVDRTVSRFAPAGVTDNAQTAPNGRPWARPHPSTLRRRRKNKRGATQALVDRGDLRKSIRVLSKDLSTTALHTTSGGKIIVGVDPSSRAAKYAAVHQYGGRTPQGATIVARPFLGFSAEDIRQIGNKTRTGWRSAFRG